MTINIAGANCSALRAGLRKAQEPLAVGRIGMCERSQWKAVECMRGSLELSRSKKSAEHAGRAQCVTMGRDWGTKYFLVLGGGALRQGRFALPRTAECSLSLPQLKDPDFDVVPVSE
jgi:hypothetical protein